MAGLESQLLALIAVRDWKKIIQLSESYTLNEKSRFSWAWPSEKCLQKLKKILHRNSVRSILSIGCGSGLLEWILEQTIQLPVTGIEMNNSLWTSNYSPPKFVKMNFIQDDPTAEYLRTCAATVDNFALLFCYFNNREAFDKYIEAYNGNVVIIVGPRNDCGICTDPLPLDPKFCELNGSISEWHLSSVIDIDEDDCNVAAVYRRK